MSVGDDHPECPLCLDMFEVDDINFFPCSCGYQICRFCWHRLRTEENGINGLCPACRKQFTEDPAEFKPLSEDEFQRIKKERRQHDSQKKNKTAESRKHLASVRVVQKNLVFLVGLTQRLADAEILKKHEYFGKFGKIHKVVINTTHANLNSGSLGKTREKSQSVSAYVTFYKPEDALRAIQHVNNVQVDGRTLKASLGTTKYCSHFLRGANCNKSDCMYLHELGEQNASFTKEDMQQGKHLEYELKLFDEFNFSKTKFDEYNNHCSERNSKRSNSDVTEIKYEKQKTEVERGKFEKHFITLDSMMPEFVVPISPSNSPYSSLSSASSSNSPSCHNYKSDNLQKNQMQQYHSNEDSIKQIKGNVKKEESIRHFVNWNGEKNLETEENYNHNSHDDELGFDPWLESTKGLADLVQRECLKSSSIPSVKPLQYHVSMNGTDSPIYPWMSPHVTNHNNSIMRQTNYSNNYNSPVKTSKLLPLMQDSGNKIKKDKEEERENNELLSACMNPKYVYETSLREMQDDFRALLPPDVNVCFGGQNSNISKPIIHDLNSSNAFSDPAILSAGLSVCDNQKNDTPLIFNRLTNVPPPGFKYNNTYQPQQQNQYYHHERADRQPLINGHR